MSDYLQDTEKLFFDELVKAQIVARNGEILDANKYMAWLKQKQNNIRSQLQQIPEPGDVYDRYQANLLLKDIDVINGMIHRQQNIVPNNAQRKSTNRENELLNQKSLFGRALELLRKR